jgi:menaquinone-9 beta-reductase
MAMGIPLPYLRAMNTGNKYDVMIAGGGLAGLSLAIQLARKYRVIVFEKDSYPKHKVCGEYISMESKPFLQHLGLPVDDMALPVINKLLVTDTRGNKVNTSLPMGGFGISRYLLDEQLSELALEAGVTLLTKSKVDDIQFTGDTFSTTVKDKNYTAKVACGAWGKRSNVDVKMQRPFIEEKSKSLNNYLGIKYHIRYPWPQDCIGLHNFADGYCGISPIEEDKVCLCYLSTAATLQKCDNDIKRMEREVLMKNPWLDEIFNTAEFLYESPLAISQISFQKKEQVMNHVLLTGDAAGMITPLCGNGMSMAFRSAKVAAQMIDGFLCGHISRSQMEKSYSDQWKKIFAARITLGRIVQSNFGKNRATSLLLTAANHLPFLRKALVSGTSGQPF